MKKSLKIFLIIFLICAIIFGVNIAGFIYKTDYKKTEIKSNSHDKYSLTVYEIGEPDFPFGSAHCRFVLRRDKEKISSTDFEVCNDGGAALESNFDISWNSDGAEIIVNAEEQEDCIYYIYFNGKTKISQSHSQ